MARLDGVSEKLNVRAAKTKEVERELGLQQPKPVMQNKQLLQTIFQKLKGQPQEQPPAPVSPPGESL